MGSSGRKRSADHMGSPSDPDPTKKTRSGRKKKDKKPKKAKEDASAGGGNAGSSSTKDGSSLEVTATAEGKQMAQVLSTFSRMEQSRFEAFRKAAFPGDAIAKYVAHCLVHEQHRPLSGAEGMGCPSAAEDADASDSLLGAARRPPSTVRAKHKTRFRHLRPVGGANRRPVLSEVVAPGQAGDITVVVSTLAKEYAQRLVTEARKHTAERRRRNAAAERNNDHNGDHDHDDDPAIAPGDILRAYAHREARGLDPGFFLQGHRPSNNRSGSGGADVSGMLADPDAHTRQDRTRSVALAAQEAYDREQTERETAAANADDEPPDEPLSENKNEEKDGMELEFDDGDSDSDGDDNDNDNDNSNLKDEDAKDKDPDDKNDEQNDNKGMDGDCSQEETAWDRDETESEPDEHPSDTAARIFARHVQRMVARHQGIAIVMSSDSEDEPEAKANNSKTIAGGTVTEQTTTAAATRDPGAKN
eukprot:jgi/Psemu1/326017/estExt_fgenesh1_pg.C_3110008